MSENKNIYTVLIIDDAFFIRNLIKRAILTKPEDINLGYKFNVIGEAINGKEGIAQYFKLKPDIITLDINMPDMNGIEVAKQIIDKDPNAKIVTISGNLEEAITQDILNVGALEYIQKPFQNAYLWEKLDQVVDLIEGGTNKNEHADPVESIEKVEDIIEIVPKLKIEPKVEKTEQVEKVDIVPQTTKISQNKITNNKKIEVISPLSIIPKEDNTKTEPEAKTNKSTEIEDSKTTLIENDISVSIKNKEKPLVIVSGSEEDVEDDLLSSSQKQPNLIKENTVLKEEDNLLSSTSTNTTDGQGVIEEIIIQEQKSEAIAKDKSSLDIKKEPIKKIEDVFNFSSEVEFNIEEELPITKCSKVFTDVEELIIKSEDEEIIVEKEDEEIIIEIEPKNSSIEKESSIEEEISIIVSEDEPKDDEVIILDNGNTEEIEINTNNKSIDIIIDNNVTQNVTSNTISSNNTPFRDKSSDINETDEAIIIIDGNKGSDIEINVQPQKKENTDTLIIIEGTSEDRETSVISSKVVQPQKEVFIDTKEHANVQPKSIPEPVEDKPAPILSVKEELPAITQPKPLIDSSQTNLRITTTSNKELNNNKSNYNKTNNEVSSSTVEKDKSTIKIAPPRSKVLREIYSEKIPVQYKADYFDEEDIREVANKKVVKKDGFFSTIKKLFNKK